MMPVERAASVYTTEDCPRSFRDDLQLHLLNGYVHSTPEFFVMARPVWAGADLDKLTDPSYVWPVDHCNCWWIYLFAGDLAAALKLFPFKLALFGWERENEPRLYDFDRGLALLQRTVSEK